MVKLVLIVLGVLVFSGFVWTVVTPLSIQQGMDSYIDVIECRSNLGYVTGSIDNRHCVIIVDSIK